MRSSWMSFLLCVMVFSLGQLHSISLADLVDETCEKTPNFCLCEEILRSDGRSSEADVAGLAIIMVDAINAITMATVDRIKELSARSPDLKTKAALRYCAEVYRAVLIADIPSANQALRTGDPKFAEQGTDDAAKEAYLCEISFDGASPISTLNKSVADVCRVASAMIRLLL